LASSARPFEIMMGKVIGIGAVGLTQVLFWVIISAVLLNFGGSIVGQFVGPDTIMKQGMMSSVQHTSLPAGFELPYISPWLFVAFIFYFLSGYFLYATLFAAVGSAVDQESDAQQLQAPVSMMIVIPILFIGSVISNPDGVLSVVLSLFPFFSPMLMIVRLAATQVPVWQIILSVILMLSTFLGSVWVAARIYRVGILMYGKKPKFKDIFKWIRLAR
jgi:ABC-2 type transport system permease protein